MSEALTPTEFAARYGCTLPHVTGLKKAGRLVLADDGKRILYAESVARIEATRDPAKLAVAQRHAEARGAELDGATPPAPAAPPAAEPPDHNYQDARAKREHYAALQEELNYRQAAGELVELAQVVAAGADIMTVLRNALESAPDTWAPRLAPLADEQEIRAVLAEEVELILGAASERLAEMGRAG